jgi:hypothetical protein
LLDVTDTRDAIKAQWPPIACTAAGRASASGRKGGALACSQTSAGPAVNQSAARRNAMTKRAIDTPIREAVHLPDGMAITLSDNASLPLSELVIEISFRCAPDKNRHAQVNHATILTFARDALNAQIAAITREHGPIPHEL